jgi:hypothetical protein
MEQFFKYEKGYWYPHMKPRDIEIWERFISKFPDAYERCQYDFGIGDVPDFVVSESIEEMARMSELYKLKIDVLGYKGGTIDLIEIKPSAGPSSIGQLQSYVSLYMRDEKPTQKVIPVLVTDELRPNMQYLTEQAGVKLIVV